LPAAGRVPARTCQDAPHGTLPTDRLTVLTYEVAPDRVTALTPTVLPPALKTTFTRTGWVLPVVTAIDAVAVFPRSTAREIDTRFTSAGQVTSARPVAVRPPATTRTATVAPHGRDLKACVKVRVYEVRPDRLASRVATWSPLTENAAVTGTAEVPLVVMVTWARAPPEAGFSRTRSPVTWVGHSGTLTVAELAPPGAAGMVLTVKVTRRPHGGSGRTCRRDRV
jgi:hypothetical protein